MTASGHALIGAAIVTKIPDLRISLPLTLASHFLLDAPEHWDTGADWKTKGLRRVFNETLIDLGVGYTLVALVFILWLKVNPVNILLGVFVSQLPDFLEAPYFFFHWHVAPWTWVNRFQMIFHKKLPQINLTLVNQIALCAVFVLLAAWK